MALDAARLNPKSGITKQLVIFLHGYGADGNDLIEIGRQWQALLPDAAFVSPHAPERMPMGSGRQWFALTMRDPAERWRGVNHAQPGLEAFIDEEIVKAGVAEANCALVGFSQGTMMALHVGLRRKVPLGAILGYSGVLIGPEHLEADRAGLGVPPPVLLVHGDQDQVIPVEALYMSSEKLAEHNIPVQWHMSSQLGHGIDNAGLKHGGQFLAQSFGLRIG